MLMKPTYKFSIVSAIYNTAEYLEEMIQSVINQDIGFEENVQLILVNDGSTDHSREICLEYQEKYPNNIIYMEDSHLGVSAARNTGLVYVKGKYVNFLDSDDKLDSSAMSKVYNFFEENYNEIDVVAIPLYFFDKEQGEHILNKKFTSNRIIDIGKEYTAIQLSSSSTFIKSQILGRYRFSESLIYGEDAKLVTEIICIKGMYGVVSDTKYWYRRRISNNSAIQNSEKEMSWYADYIKYFSKEILRLSKEKEVYKYYIQYLIMYDLQWKINNYRKLHRNVSIQIRRQFMENLIDVIKYIDIIIIIKQKNIKFDKKIILSLIKIFNGIWRRYE